MLACLFELSKAPEANLVRSGSLLQGIRRRIQVFLEYSCE